MLAKSESPRSVSFGLIALMVMCGSSNADVSVSELKAEARDGQVFLTWKEAETPVGSTFNVYLSESPIANVAQARRIAHHIEAHSARDWWEDPASFKKDAAAGIPVGFRIENGAARLDSQGGLFVHTIRNNSQEKLFFAVTHSDAGGQEDTSVVAGSNSFSVGIVAASGEIKPIWQRENQTTTIGSGKGKTLWLNLHGKGGIVTDNEYLVFGDEAMGWREGLPFKFSARVEGDAVVVRPTDRVWINRPHTEASDGGTKAIWTFWYGYNSNIYDRKLMASGTPTNYTERRNLWILAWVGEHYQLDANRWYCSGSSMGGCGTMSFGLRHPELFAACHANVPIVNYSYLGTGSARRLEPSCWTGPITPELKTNEGLLLLDRMNCTKFVTETSDDLPFVFLVNGRQDGSIPWENNPPLYRALSQARQGFAAYWDNGTHATSGKDAPEDVKAWAQRFRSFRRDQSYPAFSNTSSNRNPGDGRPENGDLIGWINRGMDWNDIEDTPDHYAITIIANYSGIQYPVRTDITLRRVQQFKIKPTEKLEVFIGDGKPITITVSDIGRITIPNLTVSSKTGVRIIVRRN